MTDRPSERRLFGRHASRRRKMAKRKGSSASGPRTRSKAAKEGREAREAENARRLEKLPLEVWDKILDHLESDDLFPLALSCRYFRQKQKELVERARQKKAGGGKPRRALKTRLWQKVFERQPASVDYLRFCCKKKVPRDVGWKRAKSIMCLAAYHGYLPLLQELLKPLNILDRDFIKYAGESSSFSSPP